MAIKKRVRPVADSKTATGKASAKPAPQAEMAKKHLLSKRPALQSDLEAVQAQVAELAATVAGIKDDHKAILEEQFAARIAAADSITAPGKTAARIAADVAAIEARDKPLAEPADDSMAATSESPAEPAADLETARKQIADLTATIESLKADHAAMLDEQTAARTAAEQALAELRANKDQKQSRNSNLPPGQKEEKKRKKIKTPSKKIIKKKRS